MMKTIVMSLTGEIEYEGIKMGEDSYQVPLSRKI